MKQRIAGAALLLLIGKIDPAAVAKPGHDFIGQMADDDTIFHWSQCVGRPQDMFDKGQAGEFMKRFRPAGSHPRTLAGSKDQNMAGHRLQCKRSEYVPCAMLATTGVMGYSTRQ